MSHVVYKVRIEVPTGVLNMQEEFLVTTLNEVMQIKHFASVNGYSFKSYTNVPVQNYKDVLLKVQELKEKYA